MSRPKSPRVTRPCAGCGAIIKRVAYEFRSARPVCSPRCRGTLGAAAAPPIGTRRFYDGASYVYVGRDHHLANAKGYAREARLVAEATLGRQLDAHEIVVCLNGDPCDVRPENLAVKRIRRAG